MAEGKHTPGRAIEDVATERKRQINTEGWTPEHDDAHKDGTLVSAAVAYAAHASVGIQVAAHKPETYQSVQPPGYWPWDRAWWKPKNPRRDLVRAAALIIAEIERLDRAEARRD
jgi:hypothetical protein